MGRDRFSRSHWRVSTQVWHTECTCYGIDSAKLPVVFHLEELLDQKYLSGTRVIPYLAHQVRPVRVRLDVGPPFVCQVLLPVDVVPQRLPQD